MKRFKLFSNIALMGLLALGATSCSDWLTLYPQDRIVEEDFWEDKNDLEGVRYAAYKQMAANINKFLVWGDIRSDNYDIASQTGYQSNREVYQNIRAAQLDSTMSLYDWGAVYTTINYCNKVINSGKYAISTKTNTNGYTGYEQVFMGDNDVNEQAMKEIIFPIRQDGKKTEEYAGSTYLVSSMRISGMPYSATSNYWSCNFARQALVQKFFKDLRENYIIKKIESVI